MELLIAGSASQYAKNMALKTQWNLKKQSGDLSGHKKSLSDYVNITKASSVLPQTDEADSKMSAIMTKAQAGKKLSYDEWEYLRAKNPMMYEKLREIEKEQKDYEEQLKRCKTKDEAQRLHLSKLGDILTAAKNGDESALVRLNRLTQTMTEFTKSEEYHDLPTEAEEAVERAREEALQMEEEIKKEADTESKPVEETEADTDTEAVTEENADAEPVKEAEAETETKPVEKAKARPVKEAKAKPVKEARAEPVREAKAEPVKERRADFKFGSPYPEPSFGRREYASQRDSLSRNNSRRRAFDTNA